LITDKEINRICNCTVEGFQTGIWN